MSDEPTLLYLEADDEVTAVVRRLRGSPAGRIIVVTPGRSRATSSVVTLRLLGRVAAAGEHELVVVGDALTRSLASEAGVPAFATVGDARDAALPASAAPADATHARINVVRGPAAEDDAPTLAAIPVPPSPGDETRAVPVQRAAPRSRPVPRRRPAPVRPRPLVAVLGVAAALVVIATVAGAMLLPAAAITVVPRAEPVGPVEYAIEMPDAERLAGRETATATVTATGSYEVQEPASGRIVLFNWNDVSVQAPAGTLVAAGEQAFETQEPVSVPSGQLTADGRIQAGEAPVEVVAAAVGPAANVGAGAIDTVLNQATAAALRGFENNPQRLVTNPEPTSGGIDDEGLEFTQGDVDAAVAALRDTLTEQLAEAMPSSDERIVVPAEGASEPSIEGLDGLVGTRDAPEVEISGSVEWEAFAVDREAVEQAAIARFTADTDARPAGHEVLEGATRVAVGEARLEDGVVVVDVTVHGRSTRPIDREEVIEAVVGRSELEAEAALLDLGEADVRLWPGWVASVPEQVWRIEIVIEETLDQLPGVSPSP